jgi:uncharacterized protein with HEPN domain
MSERTVLERLRDARTHACECQSFMHGVDEVRFTKERAIRAAVCFWLVVIGEALNRVPKDVQALAPDIPWAPVIASRNRLVHAYWLTDPPMVMRIAQRRLEPLLNSLDSLIESLD